jgi:DNA-directed RNA polymerase III subunit RPC6
MFKLGSQIIYKLNASVSTSSTKSFENEEKLVYQIIESSGNKGIWIRDIRCNSNLSATTIRKILKTLESKKFIKSIKSVAASKKKVYMLYDLEPHEEITGGAWYSEQQEFETEYVDVLNAQCLRFLHQKVSVKYYFINAKKTKKTSL